MPHPLWLAIGLAWPLGVQAQAAAGKPAGPVTIDADRIEGKPDIEARALGRVELRRGPLRVLADQILFEQERSLVTAEGHVQVEQDGNRWRGPKLLFDVERDAGTFFAPEYFFARAGAGGRAQRVEFIDRQHARLDAATYSGCSIDGGGAPDWLLTADRVAVDFEANEGVADGAVLRFLGLPILAWPALSFPVTDARKSGWLPPKMNLDSRSGFEFGVPYYWNIAPRHDATITPTVYTRRGFGLGVEFRYIEPAFGGDVQTDVLPSDHVAGRARHALQWHHRGAAAGLAYRLEVARVSDDAYWKDFPRGVTTTMPRLLPSAVEVARDLAGGAIEARAYARAVYWQALQTLDAPFVAPYQRSPQLGANASAALGGGLRLDWQGEVNHFTLPPSASRATVRPQGWRAHMLGSLSWPWRSSAAWFTPKLALNAAAYRTEAAMSDGRRDAARTIPTVSVDAGLVLERRLDWFGLPLVQTLEPRAVYADTPYRAQSSQPVFDSASKDFNTVSIFSENPFTGVDRVADAHQVTLGASTRLLDPASGGEVARGDVAQRILLREQRITADDGPPLTRRASDLLVHAGGALGTQWALDAIWQYNPQLRRSTRSVLALRHFQGDFRTVTATYSLARDGNGAVTAEQAGLGWQWPLLRRLDARGACTATLYGVGHVAYSMRERRLTDSIAGLEYDAGCWIARVVAERLAAGTGQSTTRLLLQLELVGLSRLGTNPLKVLKDNIPGYKLLREERPAYGLPALDP